MNIFPAIDLYNGCAVRLFKGEYDRMTIYNKNPLEVALDFEKSGAGFIHMVDLEGAKNGLTPNIETVKKIVGETKLFTQIGGGIRSMETIKKYLDFGINRVVLGTAAVKNSSLVEEAVSEYGNKIAVGVDIKDGFVATDGWTENSKFECFEFCEKMCKIGVRTLICTDISKDGAMRGTNRTLYSELSEKFPIDIIASGGISTMDDIKALCELNLYGAIIGRAYYIGAIDLRAAIEVSL